MYKNMKKQYLRFPFITAHSGCMNTKENSIESIIEGIKHGADILEIDINITSDGIPVLFHDKSIFLKGKNVFIKEIKYTELTKYCNGLLKLNEALELIREKGKLVNLDIKALDAFKIITDTVIATNMAQNVFFTGCNAETAYKIKIYYPKIQVLLNTETEIKQAKHDCSQLISSICNKAVTSYCCGINVDYRYCESALIEFAKRRGLLVFVWTINDIENMKKFIEMGVDSITTNEVEKLKNIKNSLYFI